jgi:hypothetical protein
MAAAARTTFLGTPAPIRFLARGAAVAMEDGEFGVCTRAWEAQGGVVLASSDGDRGGGRTR